MVGCYAARMAPRFLLAMACLGGAACTADQFVNGDAGSDGGGDAIAPEAGPDVIMGEGGSGDGGGSVDGSCGASPAACGGGCSNAIEACCVTSNTAQCTSASTCFGTSLICQRTSDCLLDGGGGSFVCCLVSDGGLDVGCPNVLHGTGGYASCLSANQCSTAGRRLCANDNECVSDHCIRANFAADPAASIGICAN